MAANAAGVQSFPNTEQALENLKQEWTARQHDIAEQAIFEDHDLSFRIAPATGTSANGLLFRDDFYKPIRRSVERVDSIEDLHVVGGLDISFSSTVADEAVATLAILSFPGLELLHEVSQHIKMTAPYIPSFLSMREAGPLVDLVNAVRNDTSIPFPQVFLIDGNGRLHEREAGLAVAVGVLAGVPTIGCAKDYHPIVDESGDSQADWRRAQKAFKQKSKAVLRGRGDWLGIHGKSQEAYIGAALLTSPAKDAIAPLFVSPGHRISLESALVLTLACCKNARVPEPVRQADAIGRRTVKEA